MPYVNFTPFPELETERLLLRRLTKEDVNEIFLLRSNASTMMYIPRPLLTNQEEALEHLAMIDSKLQNNEGINWAITLKSSPKMIGIIGHYRIQPENHRCEIGYMLLPEHHGKGIISEAVHKVSDYGFNVMQMHSIEGIIDPANIASEKVLQKNGYVKEAHLIENIYYDGQFLDTVIYSQLKRNFNKKI